MYTFSKIYLCVYIYTFGKGKTRIELVFVLYFYLVKLLGM